jgi:hypothetical protein
MNTKLDARIRALVVEVVEKSPAPPAFEALGERALANASRAKQTRARSRRRVALAGGVAVLVLALGTGALLSLGDDDGSRVVTPGASTRVGTHGVSVAIPKGWNSNATTTSLVDPAEAFAVGTFPLRSGMNSCPVNALADLGTRDAFVSAYVWAAAPAPDLPTRPTRFGPKVPWETHNLCSRLAPNGTTRSLDFQERGRQVMVTVVLGKHVSSSVAAQAYRVLDSLVVEPLPDVNPTIVAACATPSQFGTNGTAHEVHGATTKGDLWGLALGPGNVPPRAGEELKIVWRMTGTGPLHVVFTGPDGKRQKLVFGPQAHTGASTYQRPGDEWGTQFRFTAAGCWHIHLERTNTSGDVWLDVGP